MFWIIDLCSNWNLIDLFSNWSDTNSQENYINTWELILSHYVGTLEMTRPYLQKAIVLKILAEWVPWYPSHGPMDPAMIHMVLIKLGNKCWPEYYWWKYETRKYETRKYETKLWASLGHNCHLRCTHKLKDHTT